LPGTIFERSSRKKKEQRAKIKKKEFWMILMHLYIDYKNNYRMKKFEVVISIML